MNIRVQAAIIIDAVSNKGLNLNAALEKADVKAKDKPLLQEICYGCLRWHWQLQHIISKLLTSNSKKLPIMVNLLLEVGIYQLMHTRIPDYAAIDSTVEAAKELKLHPFKNLVNGVLRNFLRQKKQLTEELLKNEVANFSHPKWLIKEVKNSWPQQWQQILTANNARPPMWLRINNKKINTSQYLQLLQQQNINATTVVGINSAVLLENAINVESLPLWEEGGVSVQDGASQIVASLMQLKDGDKMLDACAAPGGKTCHALEAAAVKVTAIDNDKLRIDSISQNLSRLQLEADIIHADARDITKWWNNKPFQKILLDAPCSATGVIRRHPDIKSLRRSEDIHMLQQTQMELLQALWQVLEDNGILLYTTCSVLKQENEDVIAAFLKQEHSAKVLPFELEFGYKLQHGWQLLPGENSLDGFYYCRLQKSKS